MGLLLSKDKSAEQIERSFRRENCRITKKTLKLISRAYTAGYMRDFEFNVLLCYLRSIKSRQDLYPDQALINAIGNVHDILVQTIQERRLTWDLNSIEPSESGDSIAPTAPPSEVEGPVYASKPATADVFESLNLTVVSSPIVSPPPNLYPRL
jgi:hypothetical protein